MNNMKRSRGEMESIANMAKCLILLSRGGGDGDHLTESVTTMAQHHRSSSTTTPSRVFECKTCSRQFPSFQALGGHRASHKKPRLVDSLEHQSNNNQLHVSQVKPKIHECSICGLEFAIGQALGGHMRRHRAAMSEAAATAKTTTTNTTTAGLSSSSSISDPIPAPVQQVPVLKRSNSRRVLCLDLNLSPPDIGVDFEFSSAAAKISSPVIHCFI